VELQTHSLAPSPETAVGARASGARGERVAR
jgi:hypothetical protein